MFLLALLLNTLAAGADRVRTLRSLLVIFGSAFILKFIVLAALSDQTGGRLKRVLLVLVEGVTLGTLTQDALGSGRRLPRILHADDVAGGAGDAAGE